MKRSSGSAAGPHVVVRSIAFTSTALELLEDYTASVGAASGKKASASAVVRALLRLAAEVPDVKARLASLIEHEQTNELVSWGKPPKSR